MKKMLVLATVVAFATPVFAGDKHNEKEGPKLFKGPHAQMMQKDPQAQAEFKAKQAEMKAQKEKMEATEKKLEKLVKEYKAAKEGSSKKEKARTEIEKVLGEVREDQIAFRAKQIEQFETRLADMKTRLADEQQTDTKAAWVNEMTDRVIEQNGDLKKVFEHPGHMGKGDIKGPKGPGGKGGFKGGKGVFKGGPRRGPVDDILPMPPAPQEEK